MNLTTPAVGIKSETGQATFVGFACEYYQCPWLDGLPHWRSEIFEVKELFLNDFLIDGAGRKMAAGVAGGVLDCFRRYAARKQPDYLFDGTIHTCRANSASFVPPTCR